jgi:hypothetical protein
MKNTFLAIVILVLSGNAFAQTGNLYFYSENGEKFSVVINGLRKNDLPQSQVRVTGLIAAPYLVKIILSDTSSGVLNAKIYAADKKEKSFVILPKQGSGSQKGTQEASADKDLLDETNTKYMLKPAGENTIYEAGTIQPSMGFSKNNPPQPKTATESPNPCSYPFNDGSFAAAVKHMEAANQNDSQLSEAMKLVSNNCLSCNQIRQLVKIFTSEANRLQLAKYAYDFAFDQQNYDKVINSFTAAASAEELRKYIENRK